MPQALSIIYPKTKTFFKAKKKKASKGKKNKIFVGSLLNFILISGFFFLYLYLNLQVVEINFNLREGEKELRLLENEIKQLEVKLGNFLSLAELEKRVRKFGLVKADDVRYLKIEKVGSLTLEE